MRKHTDANQDAIVRALRQCGATVMVLSAVGNGCPDLLAGKSGRNFLLEVKDPTQKPSNRALTPQQKLFHSLWRGQVAVVETVEDALKLLE